MPTGCARVCSEESPDSEDKIHHQLLKLFVVVSKEVRVDTFRDREDSLCCPSVVKRDAPVALRRFEYELISHKDDASLLLILVQANIA